MTLIAIASEGPATKASAKAGSTGRNGGIDALRAAVSLLVVLHHTSITYGAIGGWYYKEIAPSSSPTGLLLILFCTVNQAWFMGLFFLLAGYFTPPALDRRGAAGFARERLLRLGLPLLVYFVLIHQITVALVYAAKGIPFTKVVTYMWSHGEFEPGPLWFAEAILIFSAVFVLLRIVRSAGTTVTKRASPSNGALLTAAIVTGALAFLLRLVWPVGVNVLNLQLGYFASYVVLFVAGCLGSGSGWLVELKPEQKRLWLRVAWIVLPLFPILELIAPHFPVLAGKSEGGWNLHALAYAFWEPFVAWGFILGLLSFFQRHFADLTGIWPSLARRAFLIYIIHPPMLVAVALAWRDVAAPALLKFAVTGSIACALCYLAAGLFLRVHSVARIV